MAKHTFNIFDNPIDPRRQAAVLEDYTPLQRDGLARIRFCNAYCPDTDPTTGIQYHNPSCAYATHKWVDAVIRAIRNEVLTA